MYPYNPLNFGQPQYNPYYLSNLQPNFTPQLPHMEIMTVNNKEAIDNFLIGPNSSAILVDAILPKIYMVTTDSTGSKLVKSFTIAEDIEEEKPIVKTAEEQIAELSERLTKMEERMNRNGQSNPKPVNQSKPGNGNVQQPGTNIEGSKGSVTGA